MDVDRVDIRDSAQRWLEYLAVDRRLAERTIITYRSSLTCWLNILPDEPVRRDLQVALAERMPRDQKAVAYNSWVAVDGFLRWWSVNGGPPAVTAQMAKPPKPRAHRPAMTDQQVAIGINRLALTDDLKARAICYLIILAGPRVGDIAALQVDDVDFTPGRERIRFRDRKAGESDEWYPLSPRCADVVAEYLRRQRIPGGYVFPGPNGRMTNAGIEKAWHRVLGDLPVSPHQGRHYFATAMLRRGKDIFTVSRHLGHSSIAVTQIYLDYDQDGGREGVSDLADHVERLAAAAGPERPVPAPARPGRAWRRGRRGRGPGSPSGGDMAVEFDDDGETRLLQLRRVPGSD